MDELLTQGLTAMLPSSQASARSVCFATNRLARTVRPDDATADPSSSSARNAAAAELLHVFTDVFKFKSSEIIALVIQTHCVEVEEFRAATTSQRLSQRHEALHGQNAVHDVARAAAGRRQQGSSRGRKRPESRRGAITRPDRLSRACQDIVQRQGPVPLNRNLSRKECSTPHNRNESREITS